MSRLRLPSLRTLLLLSFVLVLLPLILALGSALYSLENLTGYSREAVYRSVRVTQGGRLLLEQLTAMERSAKQALILDDPALFDHYRRARETLKAELRALLDAAARDAEMYRLLRRLEGYEFDLYAMLIEPRMAKETKLAVADQFRQLRRLANDVWQLSISLVGKNLEALDRHSLQARRQTMSHLMILLPVAGVLMIFFIYLLNRPIRQLDAAIRKLGDRDFEQPIVVQGPRDLEALGQRLDWLRIRLRMLEAEKQRFMRNISHELKTPLANINEGGELLADHVVGELNTEQAEIVRIIVDNAGRLYRMIEDLIRYSQLQDTDTVLRPQMIDMAQLVDEVINEYEARLKLNEIHLHRRIESVEIRGFPELLRSMVDNLLSNAVKYSPQGGIIEIGLFKKGGRMIFEITDQGPGIPHDERGRIFDALYQGRVGRRMGIEGTGVGLAIVNECVMLHRGRIEILDREGWGACFRVTLPLDGVSR